MQLGPRDDQEGQEWREAFVDAEGERVGQEIEHKHDRGRHDDGAAVRLAFYRQEAGDAQQHQDEDHRGESQLE